MESVFPDKLQRGDEVRVVAPARSLAIISKDSQDIASHRFHDLGLKLSFGQHVEEMDEFASTSIEARIDDLHHAFSDNSVKAILTVIGGFNSNQLLRYLDWELIKKHPKIFCGFSDITALNNSLFTKTGLVNYSGPHYSSFGQELYFEYTLEYFKKCLLSDEPFDVLPSSEWSDDPWYKDQKSRTMVHNSGWQAIHAGMAKGTIIGGNLCTLNLLQGTEYFPDLENTILFVEDDEESATHDFDRDLQSLIRLPAFAGVKCLVIGRFQTASGVDETKLSKIIDTKRELENIPVIADVDFGHTDPKITFPVGGVLTIEVRNPPTIRIVKH